MILATRNSILLGNVPYDAYEHCPLLLSHLYGLLLGTPIRLSQNITLESSLGGRYTSLENLSSYFDPVVHAIVSYVPDAQSVLRVTTGYDRGQFIARAEQFYFISKELSLIHI